MNLINIWRHGLSIYFNCEECDKESVLHIYQHKGQTFFDAGVI